MRGVPVKTVRRWRAHRMSLLVPAPTIGHALETLPPLAAGPAAYFSLWARVRPRIEPAQLDRLVADGELLAPHFAFGLGDVLLPPHLVPSFVAARLYRVRRDARRSRRVREREEALVELVAPVVDTLTRSPAPADEVLPTGRGRAKAWAAVDELCARGRLRKTPAGQGLDRHFRLALSPTLEAEAERLLEGWSFLEELALHYLKVAGPATRDDFAWWSGASAAAARRTIEELVGVVEEVDLEGGDQAHFMIEEDAADLRRFVPQRSGHVAVLPSLDPVRFAWSGGFKMLANARVEPRVDSRARRRAGAIAPSLRPVLVGGRPVATWAHAAGRVDVAPIRALEDEGSAAVEAEKAALAALLEQHLGPAPDLSVL